jgi:short-subunit dehydrogenase
MFHSGIPVITIKPGFADTAMTWGLLKPGSPLVASPQVIASDIVKAIHRRKSVVYTPFFWRWIMLIIKAIPEPIFKRLRL